MKFEEVYFIFKLSSANKATAVNVGYVGELIRCKDCEWFIRDIQKADGTDDRRFKRRWCEIHRVETHDYGYCHWAYRRKDEGIHSDNREGS